MLKRTRVYAGVIAAINGGLLSVAAVPALSQTLERVEVTGSAVRRIDAEGALPVQVIKKEDIARSGATSTVDLLQRLSSIQGGTAEANSVGGSTFGFAGVSIHNIGETRTLVLLNGHRLSMFGGQTLTGFAAGFDLNAIPISAIERVEVLTDGASALYGADAIAGVVNFITKRDSTAGDVSIGFSTPKDGAKEKRFSLSKGFGSLAKDGYNLMLSFGHDERTQLAGASRDYAKTGNLVFNYNGKTYRSQNYSNSAIAANVQRDPVPDPNDPTKTVRPLVSPYLIANGKCPANTFRVTDGLDDFCGYDYVSTLEIYPERKRDSGMASLTVRAGEHELFADLLLSRTSQTSRIAAVPGSLSIPAGSQYHTQYLLPLGITTDSLASYRVADLGKRTNEDQADFFDLALGSKGMLAGWDYTASYAHSESKVEGEISGYPGALALSNLRRSGLLNPFVLTGEQTAAAQAALNGVNYKGYWDGGVAKLDSLSVQASREVAKLPAGPMLLALGASYRKEKFTSKPSPFAQGITTNPVTGELCDANNPNKPCDQRFGDAAASVPYSASRSSTGLFSELVIPVVKGLEAGAAVRYDDFSDFGSNTTVKGSLRWLPAKGVLVRGSVGTGYHAPSVPQLNAAPQSYGVTEDPYSCTAELQAVATSLNAVCQPGKRQYDQVAGGNKSLKPEKSIQGTVGIRVEPVSNLSLGADFWWVGIKDSFGQLTEQTVFANPGRYPGAWTTARDVATGVNYLAWNAANLNLGKSYTSGIDFDVQGRIPTPIGELNSRATATYTLRHQYQQQQNGAYFSDLADNTQGALLYRWKGNWRNTVKVGAWAHTLGLNFVSGYTDALTTVEVLNAAGAVTGTEDIRLKVKPYYTFDWQTVWAFNKSLDLTLGVLNLGDKKPPLVLATTGGQQVGYDGNLYDPRGRTLYGNLSLKF
jgi:iron complex outermembrane recepter protein